MINPALQHKSGRVLFKEEIKMLSWDNSQLRPENVLYFYFSLFFMMNYKISLFTILSFLQGQEKVIGHYNKIVGRYGWW